MRIDGHLVLPKKMLNGWILAYVGNIRFENVGFYLKGHRHFAFVVAGSSPIGDFEIHHGLKVECRFDHGTQFNCSMRVVIVWKEDCIWIKSKECVENGADVYTLILEDLFGSDPAQKNPKSVLLFIKWTSDGG